MHTSVIVTTYNWPQALDLVLRSVAAQTEMPDEVIVTDDGSRDDTAVLLRDWSARLPVPLRHLWQPDEGFRVSRARNRAIAAAAGDYIIILDGDMVLNRYFIEDHKAAARRGCFIQGVRLLTGEAAAAQMLATGRMELGFFSPGIERRRHTIRNRSLSRLVFRAHVSQRGIRASNQGYWKEDLLRANGFNEAMTGWGREDNELAARLYNNGIKRRNLKFQALATHLYHKVRHPTGTNPNDVFLHKAIEERLTRCELGLDQHLAEFRSAPAAPYERAEQA